MTNDQLMKTYLDCIPCFLRQTLEAATMASDNPVIHERMMRQVLQEMSKMDFVHSPVDMAMKIHRTLRQLSGNSDPYREIKERSNEQMMSLYPQFLAEVKSAADSLEMAIRLAIAANIIDFGVQQNLDDETVVRVLEQATTIPLNRQVIEAFRQGVEQAETILYLGDNAGEIVCDRLLIEQLPRQKVTYVVRGNPVLNDATIVDAEFVGMSEIVTVIDNGSDAPGTILAECSEAFRDRFNAADLIVAKGQGNYESLNDTHKPIFFLLRAKCPVIAKDLNCPVGVQVFQQG
ncbi:MAG: ARMT1-like domain-containing protein [Coleofasciculus sp. C2-GNP5-27]